MDTNLMQAVLENLRELIPARTVHPNEAGIRFRWGKLVGVLGTGLHWYWPIVEEIHVTNTAEESIDLPNQTQTTKDGKSVTYSVNFGFRIEDLEKYWLNVYDFERSLTAAAMIFLAKRIRALTWEELYADQDGLEESLKRSLAQKVGRWGVALVDVGITDLVLTRNYRFFSDAVAAKSGTRNVS